MCLAYGTFGSREKKTQNTREHAKKKKRKG